MAGFAPFAVRHLLAFFASRESRSLLKGKSLQPSARLLSTATSQAAPWASSPRRIDVCDPNFVSLFTPELKRLSSIFQRYDHELRIAGGAVRDILLGRRPGDVDFATTATPSEMIEMFLAEDVRVVHDRGAAHGTLMVRVNDKENFEVTTSRIHVSEKDIGNRDSKTAAVFTRQFTRDWYLDSCQRDLTINAMFLTLGGVLYDYHRGEEHLRKGRIRFVGDARHRLREDHQRILRYFRFHAQLAGGERHDEETLDVIREEGLGLQKLAGMRIWPELKKMIKFESAGEEMKVMWRLGLFEYCGLPKYVTEDRIDDFSLKFVDSFDLRPEPLTVLSPLFTSQSEVEKLCKRTVNVSKGEKRLLIWLIRNRDEFSKASTKKLRDSIVDDASSVAHVVELLKLENQRDKLEEIQDWSRDIPVFPVSAFHLMVKGFEGGPKLHQNLSRLNTIWKESEFTLSKDGLIAILERDRERETEDT